MAKVLDKKVAPKTTPKKRATTIKKVEAVAVEPEIPVLMKPSEPKVKRKGLARTMSDMEILFHTSAGSTMLIAIINGMNGGLVYVTMLLLTMACVTEMFVMVLRDYSEVNTQVVKYKEMIKLLRKKKNVS